MPKWNDEGIIISLLKKGEKGLLMNVLTKNNGRYLGWHSKKRVKNINIQPGDIVSLSWNARLSDQLGLFNFEPLIHMLGNIIEDKVKLYILSSFCSLINRFLPEREECINFYNYSKNFLILLKNKDLTISEIIVIYIKWEIEILKETGFSFDLTKCTITGDIDDLGYVSPKTGNAVSKKYDGDYLSRLLKLPHFLQRGKKLDKNLLDEIFMGLDLNLFFIKKFFGNMGYNNVDLLLKPRQRLIDDLKKRYKNGRLL